MLYETAKRFTIITFIILSTCNGLTYRNYALLHGTPRNERELKFFYDMPKMYNVTFWRRPGKVNGAVEFTISPYNYGELMIDTYNTKIRFRTIMDDVQSAFDKQIVKRYTKHQPESFNWNNYFDLDSIYDWLKDLSGIYPKQIKLMHIGKSIEQRDIFGVRLTLNKIENYKKRHRPRVMMEGGCHAREWISPAVVTYMIYMLLNAENSNSDKLKRIALMYDWYFVPVMNPDGYVYTQTVDRLWKKNRRDGNGVDLDRNFGILFGKQEAQTNKKDEEYCGRDAFSEPESAAMASFARDNCFGLKYYLSFHSYGQYIIIPYSFSKSYEDNYNSTKMLADTVAHKMFLKYNIIYKVGTRFDTMGYLASGVSADWVKRAINVTHVATIELPDTGAYGFSLPPDRILPSCEAIFDGILEFFPSVEDDVVKMVDVEEKFDVAQEATPLNGILLFCNVIVLVCKML